MTLNGCQDFERFFIFINKCTNYFKNILLYVKLFYQMYGTECAPYIFT